MPAREASSEAIGPVVDVAFSVAQMHNSVVALKDLEDLLPQAASREDLVRALESLGLSGRYIIEDGVLRQKEGQTNSSAEEFGRNTDANLATAKWAASKLGKGGRVMVAVSGSTSYEGASRTDDLDLFCVTPPGTMWLFLAKALLLTRLSRILRRSQAPICLSCVMDSNYAAGLFRSEQDALFARDALMARVLSGENTYSSLLDSARWMNRFFPRLYDLRTTKVVASPVEGRSEAFPLTAFANLLAFITLGSYIRLKAGFHNWTLGRSGRESAAFQAKVHLDHLIYESRKYLTLRQIYSQIRPTAPPIEPVETVP